MMHLSGDLGGGGGGLLSAGGEKRRMLYVGVIDSIKVRTPTIKNLFRNYHTTFFILALVKLSQQMHHIRPMLV